MTTANEEPCVVGDWMDASPFRWVVRNSTGGMWLAYEQTKGQRGRSAHRLAGMGRTLAQLAESLRRDDGTRDLPHEDDDAWGPWSRRNEEKTRADVASGATTISQLMRRARQEAVDGANASPRVRMPAKVW